MADSTSAPTVEAPKATSAANPIVQDIQKKVEPEPDQSLQIEQRIMKSVGGGNPETPPDRFAGALGRVPSSSQAGILRQLQRSYGNQYVGQVIQAKLEVGSPDDIYEREADQVAEQIMRMPEPYGSSPLATEMISPLRVQRLCDECEKELQQKPIQRQTEGGTSGVTASASLENSLQQSKGGGSPLSDATRAFMEPRFDEDFSQVRVHTDSTAAALNRELKAQAFTRQRDIYFGAGKYNPESSSGQYLLAHELVHVVQQNGNQLQRATITSPTPVIDRQKPVANSSNGEKVSNKINQNTFQSKCTTCEAEAQANKEVSLILHSKEISVQRSLFGSLFEFQSEADLIQSAWHSRDPDDIKKITNFDDATTPQKIHFLYALLNQDWLGPIDKLAIERIWRSWLKVESIEDIASFHISLWKNSVEVEPDLLEIPSVAQTITALQSDFKWDVKVIADGYLLENQLMIVSEMERLGLSGSQTELDPDEHVRRQKSLEETLQVAPLVAEAKRAQELLGEIPVGYEYRIPEPDVEYVGEYESQESSYLLFDPTNPPAPGNEASDNEIPPMQSWEEVKEHYDITAAIINDYASSFPSLYALIRSGNINEMNEQVDAQEALGVIQVSLESVLEDINTTRNAITFDDLDYRELKPIHRRLFTEGDAIEDVPRAWNTPFYRWVAEQAIEDYEATQWWIDLGLTAASLALAVGGLASGGSVALIASAAGFGLGVIEVGRSWEDYLDKSTAANATIKEELDIVDEAQAYDAATKAALDTVFLFLEIAGFAIENFRAATAGRKAVLAANELTVSSRSVEAGIVSLDKFSDAGRAVIERTAGRHGLNSIEASEELAASLEAARRSTHSLDDLKKITLPDGRRWTYDPKTGLWCRFVNPRNCYNVEDLNIILSGPLSWDELIDDLDRTANPTGRREIGSRYVDPYERWIEDLTETELRRANAQEAFEEFVDGFMPPGTRVSSRRIQRTTAGRAQQAATARPNLSQAPEFEPHFTLPSGRSFQPDDIIPEGDGYRFVDHKTLFNRESSFYLTEEGQQSLRTRFRRDLEVFEETKDYGCRGWEYRTDDPDLYAVLEDLIVMEDGGRSILTVALR